MSRILSTGGGGCYPSMHCRWYPSMPCSRSPGGWYPSMPCRIPDPHLRGKFRGVWLGGSPGHHPRGKLKGIWSRPTAKGEIEGDLVQAHTQGRKLRGIWPGGCLLLGVPAPIGVPAPMGGAWFQGGLLLGGYLLPWGGCLLPGRCLLQEGVWRPSHMIATAAVGMHPTGMHSCYIYFQNSV